jgi:hypothetical protein
MKFDSLDLVINPNLNDYLQIVDCFRNTLEDPEWLSDYSIKELIDFITNKGADILLFSKNSKPVCSTMLIPTCDLVKKKLDKKINSDNVIGFGSTFCLPEYDSKELDIKVIDYLAKSLKKANFNNILVYIHPDNKDYMKKIVEANFIRVGPVDL